MELRGLRIQLLVIFLGDGRAHLLERAGGFGVQVRSGDGDLPADVGGGDPRGERVSRLVEILGNLAMALFMFDHVLACVGRHPDGDGELERHFDVRDGDDCV